VAPAARTFMTDGIRGRDPRRLSPLRSTTGIRCNPQWREGDVRHPNAVDGGDIQRRSTGSF
jgi:hypothetical protein